MQPAQDTRGDVIVIPLKGTIDAGNHETWLAEIQEQIPEGPRPFVLLDLAEVESVDSQGLALFITVGRSVHERRGELKFCCLQPQIESLFKVTRLYLAFETFHDRERALDSFE
ncbi:MAG: STAS domain-containing protein [Planctomycetes bacterium]|nr:STAS domain-containing protein [Planctomycetota bacterium]